MLNCVVSLKRTDAESYTYPFKVGGIEVFYTHPFKVGGIGVLYTPI